MLGLPAALLLLSSCSQNNDKPVSDFEASQAMVLTRGLPTLDTKNSIAIVELDPESKNFGNIIQEMELSVEGRPFHHLYYSPAGRLYGTRLDEDCSLAEITLTRDLSGKPKLERMQCIDTHGQAVGEDIMWANSNGTQYMFVTFMGGTRLDKVDTGSVGVFDPNTNRLVKIIEARKSQIPEGAPYVEYPHGITAYKDRLIVSSTAHPRIKGNIGNSITVIDLNTLEPIENIVVESARPIGKPSAPVEMLFVRPEIAPNVKPFVLVNTELGYETWQIPYDEKTKTFGKPTVVYDGESNNTGFPLEFYATDKELFVTHAIPGVVKRYALNKLPKLIPSGPDLITGNGAHHLVFFTSKSGKKYIAVQNNLINRGNVKDNDPTDNDFFVKLNANTVTIHDFNSSDKVATIDFKKKYGLGVETIEGLFGPGYLHHH